MTDGTGILGGLRRLLGLPSRLVGRAFGYLIAAVLLLAVPVVLLAATTAVWYLPFLLLGWPDPEYDGDFDPPLLRG